ncbi:MAG: hypothetical protein HYZ93_02940 [Candidatus Omnitrophica bacterium]|nr:hypothetical protein [Candidatus Omnitrophota bacterium]
MRPIGWTLVWILIGVYFLIKLQGWNYGMRVQGLERQMEGLRSGLSSIILYKQMESNYQICSQALGQIRGSDLGGGRLLEQLSRETPPSVTVERLALDARSALTIQGSLWAGIRDPEGPMVQWVSRLRAGGVPVRIRGLTLDAQRPEVWHFELVSEPGGAS